MHRSVLARAILFSLFLTTFFSNVYSVPTVISHQGRLLDASDAPISGTFTIIYSIYDAPVGGTQLWMEDHVGVVVTDGLFSVELGSTVPLSADIVAGSGGGGGGSLRYLQVQLSGQAPIMPRTALLSSPYSIATERVSGDFQSGPGIIVIGDTTTSGYATFGEKVNAGLQAAGSALSQGASLLRQECDDTDADYLMKHSHGAFANMLHMHARVDSVGLSSSYSDPTVETGMTHSSTTDGSSFSMSTKDQSPSRISVNVTTVKDLEAAMRLGADLGDDGDEDNSVIMSAGLTSSRVAIKTKGTGADKNRTAGSSSDDTLTMHYADMDDDDDGVSEASAVSAVSSLAGAGSGAAAASYARWTVDSDDDGAPEGEISQIATPTTCGVAINTKGTGADKNRIISTTYPDSAILIMYSDLSSSSSGTREINQRNLPSASIVSIRAEDLGGMESQSVTTVYPDSAVTVQESDSDGDGISEAKAVSAVTHHSGGAGGAAAASYARMIADGDDDGVPEGDISQSVTPTTCGLAIKTKGTGADANKTAACSAISSIPITGALARSECTVDDDGDGVPEGEIAQNVTPTTCSVAIKTKGTGADKNRTISSSCDDSSAVHYLDVDDDGDGISEGRGIISVKSSTGSGSMSASNRLTCDANDDGAQETAVESSCDASSAKIIVDRDSGRSKGFMRAMETGSSVTLESDFNLDGLVDRSVISSVDSGQAEVVASEGSTQVSMKVRKGGIIKGAININHASMRQVEFDGDGNGYLSNAIGIGVDPTHHIDVVGGAYCDGTNWVNASDRNSKENFESVNGGEILEKISELEITKWNYKGDDDAQHIGPTAQDFKKTFGVGADDKSISTIDPSGIALAAIKELYAQLTELQKRDKEQSAKLQQRDAQLEELQSELKKLRDEMKKSR